MDGKIIVDVTEDSFRAMQMMALKDGVIIRPNTALSSSLGKLLIELDEDVLENLIQWDTDLDKVIKGLARMKLGPGLTRVIYDEEVNDEAST